MAKIKTPTHPIAVAVEPLRQSAMENAEKFARERIAHGYAALEKAGWDLDVAAPYDRSYGAQNEKRRFLGTIAHTPGGVHTPGKPHIVEKSETGAEYVVKMARRDAEESFIGYVNKLVGKIGDAKSAKLYSLNKLNLWAESRLSVVLPSGAEESWDTQQIWNRSVLGKSFPQWPTRQSAGTKREVVAKVALVHAMRNGRWEKLCSHPISRTAHTGQITNDVSKVTCPRCKERLDWAKAREAKAVHSSGGVAS